MTIADSDYQALAEFRYHIRRFLRFSEEAARAARLEPQQHQLLLALRGLPGGRTDIGTLAGRLQIQHHSTVELVDRLAAHGMVTRARSEPDRRHVAVELTARGEAALEKLSKAHLEELRRNGPLLVQALESLLRRTHAAE